MGEGLVAAACQALGQGLADERVRVWVALALVLLALFLWRDGR